MFTELRMPAPACTHSLSHPSSSLKSMFVEEEQLNSGKTLGTLHNQMAGLLLHPMASSPLVGAGKLGALAS